MEFPAIPQGTNLIVVLGPTACGKTRYAVQWATRLGAEIIGADSRQVYREMDLGTGKDLDDYLLPDGRRIPCHLVDICEPGTQYNVFQYQRDFVKVFQDIRDRGRMPLLCGGTGLYIEAVLKAYPLLDVPQNPELRRSLEGKSLEELTDILAGYKARHGDRLHNQTDTDTPRRAVRAIEIEDYYDTHAEAVKAGIEAFPRIVPFVVGLDVDRDRRRERISRRLDQRLEQGMVDEVCRLLDKGLKPEDLLYYGLEYKYLTLYVTGQLSYEEMHDGLETAIHQFAKRQMTWFRGMERRGTPIHWIRPSFTE